MNNAPVASGLSLTTENATAVSGNFNASDSDGDNLTFRLTSAAANGSVSYSASTGAFTYTPNGIFNGTDAFSYVANDGKDDSAPATVVITVNEPVNNAPVALALNLITENATTVNGQFSASDADSDTLNFRLVSGAANGSVSYNSSTGSFTYTPNGTFSGTDSFSYVANDGKDDSNTVSVTVTVNEPVNNAPVASNLNLATANASSVSGNFSASDADGDALNFRLVSTASNGSVSYNSSTGSFTYTPGGTFSGTDTFSYIANDGKEDSAAATVTVTVSAPVNNAPAASNLSLTTANATPVAGNFAGSDIDGDALSFRLISTPAYGSVSYSPSTGTFTYTPGGTFSGTDAFSYVANDGKVDSASASITITVLAPVVVEQPAPEPAPEEPAPEEPETNTAPIANALELVTEKATSVSDSFSGSDADGDALTYAVISTPGNGSISYSPSNGSFTYTPNRKFVGTDTFTYVANDGKVNSATVTITITVNEVVKGGRKTTSDGGTKKGGPKK